MKQLRNPWLIIPAVLIGNLGLSMWHLYAIHEFKSWSQFPDVLDHASVSAFSTTVGWLFLRSPWSAKITELIGSQSTETDGVETKTMAKVTISEGNS